MGRVIAFAVLALIIYVSIQYTEIIIFISIPVGLYFLFEEPISEFREKQKEKNKKREIKNNQKRELNQLKRNSINISSTVDIGFKESLEEFTIAQLKNIKREKENFRQLNNIINFEIKESRLIKKSKYNLIERKTGSPKEVIFNLVPNDERFQYYFALEKIFLYRDSPSVNIVVKPESERSNGEKTLTRLSIQSLINEFKKWRNFVLESHMLVNDIIDDVIIFEQAESEYFSKPEIGRLNIFIDDVIKVMNEKKDIHNEENVNKTINLFLDLRKKITTDKKSVLKPVFFKAFKYAKKIAHDVVVKLIVELIKEWGKQQLLN